MAATVRASYFGGAASEPAGVTAESGVKFNREDTQSGTTPIPIPTATGTNYSWLKNLALEVTATSSTAISNRRISMSGAPSAGLTLHFKAAAYAQPASGNMPAAAGTNDATPATYTLMTTSTQVYDSASVSTGSAGRNGSMVLIVLGVSNLFTGGAGSATSLPNIIATYDEA